MPLKPPLLAELKSNNYMLNALLMMAAQERGGTFGISVDDAGRLRESCVLNVLAVSSTGVLVTPPFKRVLAGTTVRRAMALARRELLNEGLLCQILQEELTLERARQSAELMLLAGDYHLMPITSLDGQPVGDGKVGPIARKLAALLEADSRGGGDAELYDQLRE